MQQGRKVPIKLRAEAQPESMADKILDQAIDKITVQELLRFVSKKNPIMHPNASQGIPFTRMPLFSKLSSSGFSIICTNFHLKQTIILGTCRDSKKTNLFYR